MNSSRLASLDFVWRPCISNDSTLRQAFKHSLTHSFSHSLIHRHCKSPFNQSSISARLTLLSHGFLFPFQIHYIDGPHCIQIRIQIQVHSHTYTQQEHISHFIYLIVCLCVCVCMFVRLCLLLASPLGTKGIFLWHTAWSEWIDTYRYNILLLILYTDYVYL